MIAVGGEALIAGPAEGLLLNFGEVAFWVLVELFEARLAAKFHGGALVLVNVGLAHSA